MFFLIQDWTIYPPQLQGLSQVGLHPDWVVLGLRGSSLISSEGSLQTWTTDFSLSWVGFRQSDSLSKTTKLKMLDLLLQVVCINSGLADRLPNLNFSQFSKEHKLNRFFTRFQSEKKNKLTLPNLKILLFTF